MFSSFLIPWLLCNSLREAARKAGFVGLIPTRTVRSPLALHLPPQVLLNLTASGKQLGLSLSLPPTPSPVVSD